MDMKEYKTVGDLLDALQDINRDIPLIMYQDGTGESKEILYADLLEGEEPDETAFTICIKE